MINLNIGKAVLDVAWLSVLVGMFYHFWKNRLILIDAQDWLKAKGHITRYQLVQVGHSVWPKIEYVYQVQDRNLIGHYLFLDTTHNTPSSKYSRRIAYNAAIAYNDHLEIDVYYNPNSPDESALDVTMPTKLTAILILIGLFIVLDIVIIACRFI